jgi:hypothetical protein
VQRKLKASPHNIQQGRAKGLLEVYQDYCAANFGSVTVVGEGTFLTVDDEELLGFNISQGTLEISLRLFNEKNELLLQIDRNEWVSGDPRPWDIEADWQVLTIRERARQISLSLDAREVPLELRAELWHNGKSISLGKDGISINHNRSGFRELALVGSSLIVKDEGATLGPAGAVIVSWPNRRERLWRARNAWRNIKAARQTG